METTHHTYCEFHLGDNFSHLHFLRRLAREYPSHRFIHAAHACHLDQMGRVVEDLPNISLTVLEDKPADAINAWKNAGGFFQDHPNRENYYEFHLDWYRELARQMGLQSTMNSIEELLFDYPAIAEPLVPDQGEFDFLVVNSRPCSGQLMAYDRVDYFDPLLAELVRKGYRVLVTQPSGVHGLVCTMDLRYSVTEIGNVSRRCRHHLMVSTGPSWPVLNVWNYGGGCEHDGTRILFLATERLNIPGLVHVPDLPACRAVLQKRGLL